MAKKSLKKRIDDLVNKLGGSQPPSNTEVRGRLVELGLSVEALEEGSVIRDLEEKVAVLEAALKKSNLENSNLQANLKSLKTEVDGFRAERKKQEEKEREIPPTQFEILKRLPTESEDNWPRTNDISSALGIPIDETEIHVDHLEKLGLVTRRHNSYEGWLVWHRSMAGNELVLAKRLAGEEQTPTRKYPDLPPIQEAILSMMVGENEGVNERFIHESLQSHGVEITLEKVKWILETSLKRFADYDPEEGTYGAGTTWFITDAGREYFAERDKL